MVFGDQSARFNNIKSGDDLIEIVSRDSTKATTRRVVPTKKNKSLEKTYQAATPQDFEFYR